MPMLPPLLFLDVDGVMNTTASCVQHRSGLVFTQQATKALREIVLTSDCKITISSTRRSAGLATLRACFVRNGMPDIAGRITGVTPRITGFDTDDWREDEIDDWLTANGVSGCYAILDDKPLTGPLRHRLVRTDAELGLIPTMVPRVLALLQEQGSAFHGNRHKHSRRLHSSMLAVVLSQPYLPFQHRKISPSIRS
jgi:HAD domain in Swiss Army Knife RNA repair proteins